jgi:hypothetical protein
MHDPKTWMTPTPICELMRKRTFSWDHLMKVLFGTNMDLGQMLWYIIITTVPSLEIHFF